MEVPETVRAAGTNYAFFNSYSEVNYDLTAGRITAKTSEHYERCRFIGYDALITFNP